VSTLADTIEKARRSRPHIGIRRRKKGTQIVALEFRLDEQVTPGIFAERVAEACASYGALRPGEAVLAPEAKHELRVLEPEK
jgi:hypothetical protein